MGDRKWCVVVPTNRPDRFAEFMRAWRPLFDKHHVWLIVVQDLQQNDDVICHLTREYGPAELHDWRTIGARHVPHRTDMIRSWGIYRAWRHNSRYTLTLDDDTLPDGDLFTAYERVFEEGRPFSRYLDVGALTSYGGQLRGFPFRDRKRAVVAVQFGGWHGVLDYDAPTQLAGVNPDESFTSTVLTVPAGVPVTGCIMNACWQTRYAPLMWQLPLHNGRFNRFGDIWAGLFAKKALDHEGAVMVVNGLASVIHRRASDPLTNLEREMPGIPVNERLWDTLADGDYRTVTDSAHTFFKTVDHDYAAHFLAARDEWLRLYQ